MKETLQKLPVLNKINTLEEKEFNYPRQITKESLNLQSSKTLKITTNNEEKYIDTLRATPTKSIFLEFVSTFLSNQKGRGDSRSNTARQIIKDSSSIKSAILDYPKSQSKHSPSPKNFLAFKKQINANKFAFPNLKPSVSLNNFLAKEKIRLQTIQTERLNCLKDTTIKETPADRKSIPQRKKNKKNKKNIKNGKNGKNGKNSKKIRLVLKKLQS